MSGRMNVLARRKAAGLTQAQAAARVYVTPTSWARWERGEVEPGPAHLALIELVILPQKKGKRTRKGQR